MNKLVITMPRSPALIILGIGLAGVAIVFLTEPTFVAGGALTGFTRGRYGGIIVALLITIWGAKGIVFPSTLFACSRSGIEIPVYPGLIEWRYVQDIETSSFTVGLSNSPNKLRDVESESFVIRLSDCIELKAGPRPNSHGRITAKHEYTFSTEVQKKTASELREVITGFRSQS
jgi:hypothetical protein